jgi:hypothetical protein
MKTYGIEDQETNPHNCTNLLFDKASSPRKGWRKDLQQMMMGKLSSHLKKIENRSQFLIWYLHQLKVDQIP